MSESRKWKGSNTFLSNCLKFNTIKNSKFPSSEWNKNNKNYKKDSHQNGNWGLVCGTLNDCIGLDLDLYSWNDKHPFYTFIGTTDIFKWAKEQNTLSIKTTSDGIHLIYKLGNNPLKNINDKLNIDIKCEGGYLVGAGSIVKSKITNQMSEYTILNNKELTEMPKNLIEWLSTNLSYSKNNNNSKNKNTTNNNNKLNSNIQLDSNICDSNYKYTFTDDEIIQILDNLPEQYILKHDDWLKTATAMKSINKIDLFLDYCINHKKTKCKNKNDEFYNKNVNLINNIKDTDLFKMSNMFIHILNTTKLKDINIMIDYKKYKPIIPTDLSNEDISNIHIDKLSKQLFLEQNKNYVILSDTGTGKTTLFKKYISENNIKNVISIVSRISLADDHYNQFNEEGIEIYNYRFSKKQFETGQSVVITIDSIIRLMRIDLKEYVVFLDEFNSLIEYLFTCPNLKKTKCVVFKMLLHILQNSKQIICVDADIHSNSLKILKFCDIKYDLVINSYLHNKENSKNPVQSKEIFDFDNFIKELRDLNEVLVCCDSKLDAETIYKNIIEYKSNLIGISTDIIKEKGDIDTLDKDGNITTNKFEKRICYINSISYCLITSDTDEDINLDKYDFVIFSPKIVYGLDSIRKRPVYAHYKEHTISPRGMIQQIARNRNIEYLRYIFYKKSFSKDKYIKFEDIENETKDLLELNTFELICSKDELNLYIDVLNTINYNEDCYRTNKFSHFKILLIERGFDDITNYNKTCMKNITKLNKETKEQKYDLFDMNDSNIQKINKYIKLPNYLIKYHKEIYLEPNHLLRHFNIQNFFLKGLSHWNKNIEEMDSFFNDKLQCSSNKFIYISKLMNLLKLTDKSNINCDIGLSKNNSLKFYKEYKLLFRNRTKEIIDLTDKNECRKFLYKLYSSEFGKDIFQIKRIRCEDNRIKQYTFNMEHLLKQRDISIYKYPDIIRNNNLNLNYGKENTLYNKKSVEYLKIKMLRQLKRNKKFESCCPDLAV